MAGQRTRTGCKTCRARKLKCDETKPTCGQCRKSNRECVPSEGVAFRHAQNAGFNDKSGESLKSFYKYRQKFENPYFVPIPKDLTFIHIFDPFAEDQTAVTPTASRIAAAQPSIAAHSNYAPPTQVQPGYVDVAASSLKAMIDPNLEAGTIGANEGQEAEHAGPLEGITQAAEVGGGVAGDGMHMPDAESEGLNEKIMKALQHSDEEVKAEVEASLPQ